MKMDLVFFVLLVSAGVITGWVLFSGLEKTLLRQRAPLMEKISDSLEIQKDLQAKLNYRTGDVARQMSRMDDTLASMEQRLKAIEAKLPLSTSPVNQ
ncbi:MAG: hypothetical protein HQL22_08945 [Candidatus Omnitrophica bacterium]|nr:hypothetical protein [Candidatus Omnitrophota bacterium]